MSLLSKKRIYSRCIGSTVTIHSPTCVRGVGGGACSPGKILIKWCDLDVPKYAIIKLKISYFKVNKSTTTKVNCHIFIAEVNVDEHVIQK